MFDGNTLLHFAGGLVLFGAFRDWSLLCFVVFGKELYDVAVGADLLNSVGDVLAGLAGGWIAR